MRHFLGNLISNKTILVIKPPVSQEEKRHTCLAIQNWPTHDSNPERQSQRTGAASDLAHGPDGSSVSKSSCPSFPQLDCEILRST